MLVAGVLWGTTGTSRALLGAGAHPVAVGAARLLVAGVALVVLAALVHGRRRLSEPFRPGRLGWTLLAMISMALYNLVFFAAVARTGVALGTVVAIGSFPAFTGVLTWLVNQDRPRPHWFVATALAVAGVWLLLASGGPAGVDPAGVGLALVAGFATAAFTLSLQRVLRRDVPLLVAVAAVFGGAALWLAPALALTGLVGLLRPAGVALAIWLGVFATALAYALFATGLRRVSAATASTLALAEPLTAATLGMALLGERPGAAGLTGGGLVLAGIVIVSLAPGGRPRPELKRSTG